MSEAYTLCQCQLANSHKMQSLRDIPAIAWRSILTGHGREEFFFSFLFLYYYLQIYELVLVPYLFRFDVICQSYKKNILYFCIFSLDQCSEVKFA